jgi:hypothetical protein
MHCSADFEEPVSSSSDDDSGIDVSAQVAEAAESLGGEETTDPETETHAATETSTATTDATASTAGQSGVSSTATETESSDGELLADDGLLDNTLTVIVGVIAGIVVGMIGTFVLLVATGSLWALLFGLLVWLFTTAYLVRRRTVQAAVSKAAYALSIVFVMIPLTTLSPFASMEGGLTGRVTSFGIFFVVMAVPAGVTAVIGWIAGRFVPDDS